MTGRLASPRNRDSSSRTLLATIEARRALQDWSVSSISSRFGAILSAASEGVKARTSAARSHRVTSISCPTADTTGMREATTARTTSSSLKAQRSSIEPPPRPTTRRSRGGSIRLAIAIPPAISSAAPGPWTLAGTTRTFICGHRRRSTSRKS